MHDFYFERSETKKKKKIRDSSAAATWNFMQ